MFSDKDISSSYKHDRLGKRRKDKLWVSAMAAVESVHHRRDVPWCQNKDPNSPEDDIEEALRR